MDNVFQMNWAQHLDIQEMRRAEANACLCFFCYLFFGSGSEKNT